MAEGNMDQDANDMASDSENETKRTIRRRELLSTAAIPVAAALVPKTLFAQDRNTASRRASDRIRVGLIGAGANTRRVQIPGFRRMPGVEILAVANRSLESSQRVASEFDIPRAYSNWQELLDDGDVDAVLIGTWPYMHRTLTLAALDAGKHVLCQARMANTAAEAREMLTASQRHPNQICQLVPTSTSYVIDRALQQLLADGTVGEVLSVDVQRVQRGFADYDGELDWRHNSEFSGFNTLNIGSTYESMMRWFGHGNRVMAMTKIHVPYRRDESGVRRAVSIPDHLDVLYELANGAQVHMKFSETSGFSSGNQTWIFGSEGTVHVDSEQNIFVGRRGDSDLRPFDNSRAQQASYRVEEEFINAIRGLEPVAMNTFEIGVQYMEWTEAVHRSANTGSAVFLPLEV
jgi:predicted dehydrogenase